MLIGLFVESDLQEIACAYMWIYSAHEWHGVGYQEIRILFKGYLRL